MTERTNAELLDLLAAKGPVCLCKAGTGCRAYSMDARSYCGPQTSVARAWAILRDRGAPRRHAALAVAADHAMCGHGRDEYDREFAVYRSRVEAF